jgi:hypothetical protein
VTVGAVGAVGAVVTVGTVGTVGAAHAVVGAGEVAAPRLASALAVVDVDAPRPALASCPPAAATVVPLPLAVVEEALLVAGAVAAAVVAHGEAASEDAVCWARRASLSSPAEAAPAAASPTSRSAERARRRTDPPYQRVPMGLDGARARAQRAAVRRASESRPAYWRA